MSNTSHMCVILCRVGHDPDGVGGGAPPTQPLSAIGVTPGKQVSGSIRPQIEGKVEIDLAGLDLTTQQVRYHCM